MKVSQEIWDEGKSAFSSGLSEYDCPYDMREQWGDWADWVCGYGEAQHEDFMTTSHAAMRGGDHLQKPIRCDPQGEV